MSLYTAFVGVIYDWGEHNNFKGLLISYEYFQYLHSDKRYVNSMTRVAISPRMIL
jgi:hypothetical protein